MSASAPDDARLPATAIALYALPGAGVTFQFTLVLVMYMNYGTDVLGVSPGALGAVFFASKLWDAVSDPLAGRLSDATRSRFGRRKPWIVASGPPLLLLSVAAWSPPGALEGGALVAWIALSIFGFYTAYTLFEVPHMAWGAELTQDRQARVRVFAGRQLARMGGLFLAFLVGVSLLEDPERARGNAFAMAVVVGLLATLTTLACAVALPPERFIGRGGASLGGALRDVWRNPHARILLFVQFVDQLAVGALGVLVPYLMRYVLARPDLTAEMLVLYTASSVASIPVWARLARRFEKRRLWLFAMVQSALGFGLLLFLAEGTVALMAVSSLLAGSAGGCGPTLGTAIKADVVDVDEHDTGERKEGAYFAAWAFVSKVASGVMIGLVGVSLEAVGFQPGEPPDESVRWAMRGLAGGVPFAFFAVGAGVFRRFRLDEATHARLRAAIRARAADPAGGGDPRR